MKTERVPKCGWAFVRRCALGRHPGLWLALALAAILATAWAEPSAPDVLDLLVVESTGTSVTIEAVVKPAIEGVAELHLSGPAGLKLAAGQSGKRLQLRRGDSASRERFQIEGLAGKLATVKAELRILAPDGKPWMIVTRELKVNAPAAPTQPARVPVVRTLPDGTRIVEYVSEKEASPGKPAR